MKDFRILMSLMLITNFMFIVPGVLLAQTATPIDQNSSVDDAEVGGYCPVCIMKGELVKGSNKYLATYRGKKYFFDTAEDRRMFTENPELYTQGLKLKYEQMRK
jgi:YHS domain-containing protein